MNDKLLYVTAAFIVGLGGGMILCCLSSFFYALATGG